jgi:Mor family transcriptional regulator
LYGTFDAAGRRIGYGRLAKMFEMSKSHVREIIKERRRIAEAVEYR